MASGAPANILVVDDELGMREFLELCLGEAGHRVTAVGDGEAALAKLGEASFDLVLTDVRMPRLGGLDLLDRTRIKAPDAAVVVMTAFGTVETAVEAMKRGAQDYLIKPFKLDELEIVVGKALEARRMRRENAELRRSLKDECGFGRLVGGSQAMRRLYDLIDRVAKTKTTVLITGESGSGKEMIARTIHAEGDRAGGAFVAVNCGAIPENLVESELFGHVKGAFTGAVANKEGLFELAGGGTLFL
ncbi:MAG: sigma-54 dependent transcriptional regulator, partial [Candidatus Methylomirabilis sp.]|nr:sigma-54 dependent transcriptional regulator [Deltaproteobacteria bacterium]